MIIISYLEKIDASQVDANSAYGRRLAAYNKDPKAIKAEEKLTLLIFPLILQRLNGVMSTFYPRRELSSL